VNPLLPAAAAILMASGAAQAQLLMCQEPRPPYCQDMFGPFNDRYDFQLCRDEIEAYRERVRRYIACLQDEQEEALRRLNRAIDAFNRRARS
jgi:predicted ribosome quality control (RQC) complex YloA/Tae2 family protein